MSQYIDDELSLYDLVDILMSSIWIEEDIPDNRLSAIKDCDVDPRKYGANFYCLDRYFWNGDLFLTHTYTHDNDNTWDEEKLIDDKGVLREVTEAIADFVAEETRNKILSYYG